MDIPMPSGRNQQVEVITGVQRRRRWTPEQKLEWVKRSMVMQRKTHRPVQFEITEQTRQSLATWIEKAKLLSNQYLFPSRVIKSPHLSTRQYA